MSAAMEATLLGKINDTIGKIDSQTNTLASAVNGGIGWLPPGIQDGARKAWDEFVQLLSRMWDQLRDILASLGSPFTLQEVAAAWSEQVGGPVSSLEGYASEEATEVDRYWEGDSAEAYLATLPGQQAAIAHLRATYSEPASSALSAVASAILIFWAALVVALVALVAGLIGAAIASGTIIGIPAGIAAAIAAVVVCIASVVAGYTQLRAQVSGQNNTLLQKLNDNSALRGESWPRSTVE